MIQELVDLLENAGEIGNQERLDELMEAFQLLKGHWDTSSCVKFNVPYIFSSHDKLDLFNSNFVGSILSISEDLKMYNELVEKHDKFIEMTFTVTSDDNHERLTTNIKGTESNIMTRAEIIIEKVGELIPIIETE